VLSDEQLDPMQEGLIWTLAVPLIKMSPTLLRRLAEALLLRRTE
jgi:hypothetical protein